MEMENRFDQMCAAFGLKPLDGEALFEEDQNELADTVAQFTKIAELHASTRKPGHVVEIGFLDNDEFNAFATTWESCDFIAINWGVLTTLQEMFRKAVSTPQFNWLKDDNERQAVVRWMYDCAKYFIFLHELGHISNGHTSLLVERGVPFIQEIRPFAGDKIGNLDLQTMEMDADGFASANMLAHRLWMENPLELRNEEWELAGAGATYIRLTSFAVYTVFKLFDFASDFEVEQSTHPAPPLRQYMIVNSLVLATSKWGLASLNDGAALVVPGVVDAENAHSLTSGQLVDVDAIYNLFAQDGWNYATLLLRNWHTLRPVLDNLKRGGVLPPVQDLDDGH